MTTTKTLGEVLEIRKGKKAEAVSDSRVAGSFPYIQIDEVRGIEPSKFAIDPKPVIATTDDLCIVWDGANAGTVGYGVSGAVGSTVARMRLKNPRDWDTRFLGRLLEGKFSQLNQEAQGRGATIPHVDKARLEAIEFPKIPPSEQRRIAAILDKADAIRRKREQALALADDFLQSVFLEMFGDPLDGTSSHERATLSELGRVETGKTPPSDDQQSQGADIPFVTPGDLGGRILAARRSISRHGSQFSKVIPAGSTMVCCIGATIGKMGYLETESTFNQQINSITWGPNIHPLFGYVGMTFYATRIAHAGASTTLPILNKSSFGKLDFPIPRLEQQRKFASLVQGLWRSQDRMSEHCRQSTELFASLSQRAFRGEL